MQKILIIEDDRSIAELEKDYLEMSGFAVQCAYDGSTGERLLRGGTFDLVLLDLMLPGKDGYAILRGIAEEKTIPVLIVSAKDEELYKIKGLNLGADDYITKPFGMGELVARVKSHLKVYEKLSGLHKPQPRHQIKVRGLTIDKQARRVFVDDREVMLKQKEFDLLLFLAENPNRVYDKETLFERVWGYDALSDTSTVTVHVARIREKIEAENKDNQYIETVWGAGYRFRM